MLTSLLFRLGFLQVTDAYYGRPGNVVVMFTEKGTSRTSATVRVTLLGHVPSLATIEYALDQWGDKHDYELFTFSVHGRTYGFKKNLILE